MRPNQASKRQPWRLVATAQTDSDLNTQIRKRPCLLPNQAPNVPKIEPNPPSNPQTVSLIIIPWRHNHTKERSKKQRMRGSPLGAGLGF